MRLAQVAWQLIVSEPSLSRHATWASCSLEYEQLALQRLALHTYVTLSLWCSP